LAKAKAKGKGVMIGGESTPKISEPVLSPEMTKDVEELMRYIKKSDYKIIDQLGQTPAKISILALLRDSEPHRNALMQLLGTSFVPQEISVNQFGGIVNNISASNGLGFTDFDLPPEGRKHNKALHVSVEIARTTLSRVLVDTGSSLNVLPKSTLLKLDYEGVVLRPSDLIVKAFDGSKRSVFGEVDLPIKVGPQVFDATFFVMDINPSYCCLLGRPWIHGAGAVTSTLHQKLKFLINEKVVTIYGEEDYVVSHLSNFRYVEVEGEIHETPCQAFEAVSVDKIPLRKGEVSMASYKQAQAIVKSGHPEGWGRVLELPTQTDKRGLGFAPGMKVPVSTPMSKGVSPPVKFVKGGIQIEDVDAIDGEADGDYDVDKWIYPTVPGRELSNWFVEDVAVVTRFEE
jgi:hypothetical protein